MNRLLLLDGAVSLLIKKKKSLQGVVFPATFHLLSAWFPERERTAAVHSSFILSTCDFNFKNLPVSSSIFVFKVTLFKIDM